MNSALLTDREAARELKFMSSSKRRMSEHPSYEAFKKSINRVVGGTFPAFFDFSDCPNR
jgi:hypothetical protein